MKKILGYRKLLGVSENADLQELKSTYRTFMKNWHPDKIQDNEELKAQAEEKSKAFIEAYHFLVSIAPETRANNLEAYNNTTNKFGIKDFEYKNERLKIDFLDGNSYEYLGVPKATYSIFINAPAPARFARRHIYTSFLYRSVNQVIEDKA
jgi:curved DNA-binding protein CbpA